MKVSVSAERACTVALSQETLLRLQVLGSRSPRGEARLPASIHVGQAPWAESLGTLRTVDPRVSKPASLNRRWCCQWVFALASERRAQVGGKERQGERERGKDHGTFLLSGGPAFLGARKPPTLLFCWVIKM